MTDFTKIIKFNLDRPTEDECFNAGYDSVISGVNDENCTFRFFTTTFRTDAWSRGANEARSEKGQPE